MPTPTTTEAAPTRTGPSRAAPSRASSARLTLTHSNVAWTYAVNPMALKCLRGHIVPDLAKVLDTPGLNGNGHDSSGQGALTRMARDGFVAVPHDIPTVVNGQPYSGAESNYLRVNIDHNPDGSIRHKLYSEAWKSPRMLGHTTVWDFDEAGWLQFHTDLMEWITPGELDPAQIEVATRPLIRDIRETSQRADPRAAARLQQLLIHMPREHAPDDVLVLMDASPVLAKAVKATGKRKTTTTAGD